MPGGCCLLGVCCPPQERRDALVAKLSECIGGLNTDEEKAEAAADWIVARYDLVPKGVGEAIVEGYRDAFAE